MGRNLTSLSRKGSTFEDGSAFSSIFDTWFDTQYLTGPDVCLWTPAQRPRTTFFLHFFLRHCRSLVPSHHPLQAALPDAREKRREREREKEKSNAKGGMSAGDEKEYVYFQWNRLLILRWNYDAWAFYFFSFDSNPHSSIRSTDFLANISLTNGTIFPQNRSIKMRIYIYI